MFTSNAVRSCVELHETEMNRFYEVWLAFRASGAALPTSADSNYASTNHLGGHVLRAARNYLTWIGDTVGRPITDVDLDTDTVSVASKGRAFLDEVLAGWRRHLAAVDARELMEITRKSRWGQDYTVEQMLEHAIVHPMRHRVQLERLMGARAV